MVGAVILNNGRIVGQGYHHGAGLPHAEVNALRRAGRFAKSATLYVTLEPCTFFGRTPPCVNAIIDSGIKKVVIATKDPNPLNNGHGIRFLRSKGIEVRVGILRDVAKKTNEIFFKFIAKGLPFVIVKVAQTLDGKIATITGDSKWITGEVARRYVHRLRGQVGAILVGARTVLKDDPLLTPRRTLQRPTSRFPIRVVVDSRLRIPPTSKVLKDSSPSETIIATTRLAAKERIKTLEAKGAKVLLIREKNGKVLLKSLIRELGKMEITSLMIEGGGEVIASAFQERIVDKVLFFIAPKIVGGREALTTVEGEGVEKISKAIKLRDITIKRFGEDVLIEGYPIYK